MESYSGENHVLKVVYSRRGRVWSGARAIRSGGRRRGVRRGPEGQENLLEQRLHQHVQQGRLLRRKQVRAWHLELERRLAHGERRPRVGSKQYQQRRGHFSQHSEGLEERPEYRILGQLLQLSV